MSGYEFQELLKTAFGELSTAEPTPKVQLQFSYNLNPFIVDTFDVNSGTVTQASDHAVCQTGAAANSSGILVSKDVVKYNTGQGVINRFTALFTTGVSNSTQIAGIGGASDGFFFGYNGAAFGVLRRHGGQREIRTLTVTTKSTTAENITITLDGTAEATVAVTDATAKDVSMTAREIAEHDYSSVGNTGWQAFAAGATVIFISLDASSQSGSYSLSSATTAVGTFASTVVGVAPTDTWVAQTAWSEDVMDGNGSSGKTLDSTKGNVYQIQFQWLGYGAILFKIENEETGEFQVVHKIQYANLNTSPSLSNPTMPLYMQALNGSNTSNLTVKSVSMSGFIEGKEAELGLIFADGRTFTIGNTTAETPIFTIRNKTVFQGRSNRIRLQPLFLALTSSLSGANETVEIKVYVDGVPDNLTAYADKNANGSVVEVDKAATGFDTDNAEQIGGFVMSATDSAHIDIKQISPTIKPSQTMLFTATATKGNVSNEVGATIKWKELT